MATLLTVSVGVAAPAGGTGKLDWRAKENLVDADIRGWSLPRLLEAISASTRWQVYVEPGLERTVSAHFKGFKSGPALGRLLGPFSFAVVPVTGGPVRLYVFQSSMSTATDLIAVAGASGDAIPNELVVVLKPGAGENIDDIAKRLGAKVVGRIGKLNAYRLEFADEAAATSARQALAEDSDVESTESNFAVRPPPTPQPLGAGAAALNIKPRLDGNRVLIGMVDTVVQAEGSGLKDFIVKSYSLGGGGAAPADEIAHGTAMAERIVAAGATSLKTRDNLPFGLVTADVFGAGGTSSTFQIAEGLYAVAEQGTPIINLSLGGTEDSQFLRNAISDLSKQGVVILAASGNEPVTSPTYPAAYPEVIAVTALTQGGNIAPYANRGDFVDAGAPGSAVVSYAGQGYSVTGTSVSTAHGTGIAAALAISSGKVGAPLDTLVRQALALPPAGGK